MVVVRAGLLAKFLQFRTVLDSKFLSIGCRYLCYHIISLAAVMLSSKYKTLRFIETLLYTCTIRSSLVLLPHLIFLAVSSVVGNSCKMLNFYKTVRPHTPENSHWRVDQ